MIITSPLEDNGVIGVIPIHFNVEAHYIPIDDFIGTAFNISEIVRSFNVEIFGHGIRYEIVVLPPQAGTFLSRLGVIVCGASVAVWGALESDIGKAFIKGATGNEPAFYAEMAGAKLADIVNNASKDSLKSHLEAVTNIITDSTKGFMSKDYNDLRRSGFSKERFADAYRARNDFYQTCYRNREVISIGFDETRKFPIPRRDFSRFIVDAPNKNDKDEGAIWAVEIAYVQVTSPNWDRRDSQRLWKGRYQRDKMITFIVEDEHFWELVEERSIPTTIRDTLKVQWAFIKEGDKRRSVRVIRVLEINGKAISNPLPDDQLEHVLGSYSRHTSYERDLFEDPQL